MADPPPLGLTPSPPLPPFLYRRLHPNWATAFREKTGMLGLAASPGGGDTADNGNYIGLVGLCESIGLDPADFWPASPAVLKLTPEERNSKLSSLRKRVHTRFRSGGAHDQAIARIATLTVQQLVTDLANARLAEYAALKGEMAALQFDPASIKAAQNRKVLPCAIRTCTQSHTPSVLPVPMLVNGTAPGVTQSAGVFTGSTKSEETWLSVTVGEASIQAASALRIRELKDADALAARERAAKKSGKKKKAANKAVHTLLTMRGTDTAGSSVDTPDSTSAPAVAAATAIAVAAAVAAAEQEKERQQAVAVAAAAAVATAEEEKERQKAAAEFDRLCLQLSAVLSKAQIAVPALAAEDTAAGIRAKTHQIVGAALKARVRRRPSRNLHPLGPRPIHPYDPFWQADAEAAEQAKVGTARGGYDALVTICAEDLRRAGIPLPSITDDDDSATIALKTERMRVSWQQAQEASTGRAAQGNEKEKGKEIEAALLKVAMRTWDDSWTHWQGPLEAGGQPLPPAPTADDDAATVQHKVAGLTAAISQHQVCVIA